MTRRIPWRDGIKTTPSSTIDSAGSSPATTRAKRVKAEAQDSEAENNNAISSVMSKLRTTEPVLKRPRSNSQQHASLEETFMMDGLNNDDMYRMVEDEFYLIATRFTAHLHAAEYWRLQDEAKTQNAVTIRNISRPVVGRMTGLVKKKQDRAARQQRQNAAVKGAVDDGSDEEIASRGTSLFGLMESPRKRIPRLDHFVHLSGSAGAYSGHRNTLQATARPVFPSQERMRKIAQSKLQKKATFFQSEDEDEDLDALPPHKPKVSSMRPTAKTPKTKDVFRQSDQQVEMARPVRQRPRPEARSSTPSFQREPAVESSDNDSDEALFGFQRRAKSRTEKSHKSAKPSTMIEPFTSSRDIIPDFP